MTGRFTVPFHISFSWSKRETALLTPTMHIPWLTWHSSTGHSFAGDSPHLYHARLVELLNRTYPNAESHHVNSGTPASGPEFMEKCLSQQLPVQPPNLVLIEFDQNMQFGDDRSPQLAYERMIRRVLLLPSRPAVVVVHVPTWPNQGSTTDEAESEPVALNWTQPLADHYGLPSVDLAALLNDASGRGLLPRTYAPRALPGHGGSASPAFTLSRTSGWFQCTLSRALKGEGCDAVVAGKRHFTSVGARPHPNMLGHELIATLLERLLRAAWADGGATSEGDGGDGANVGIPAPLLQRPADVWHDSREGHGGRWYGVPDEEQARERRLVPNFELAVEKCIGYAGLVRLVRSADGWHNVSEGTSLHPKLGLASSRPGSTLSLCFPLAEPPPAAANQARVTLGAIGYLRSYAPGMGNARVTCGDGCTCTGAEEPELLRGWHADRTSVTWVTWIAFRLDGSARRHSRRRGVSRGSGGDADDGGDAPCPCTVNITTESRGVAAAQKHANTSARFKVNMLMLSHNGRMDWIDAWKVRNMVKETRRLSAIH
jgi:hypothetical protein